MGAINFVIIVSNVAKLVHVMCSKVGIKIWVQKF